MQPPSRSNQRLCVRISLNSLCGISSNATFAICRGYVCASLMTLNSLCGISSNATIDTAGGGKVDLRVLSQFPLWDFFECNLYQDLAEDIKKYISQFPLWDFFECNFDAILEATRRPRMDTLSIPFVGFLRMQPGDYLIVLQLLQRLPSQFPLWDFFECNGGPVLVIMRKASLDSQFPLWDFFECNFCGRALGVGKRK